MKYKHFLYIIVFLFTIPAFSQDPYLGEIRLFSGSYAPKGWALCNGALLPINQYSALYALLGNQFGGDGTRTFALPNLNGNMAVGNGQGPGLTNRIIGQNLGSNTVTLQSNNLPEHSHTALISLNTSTYPPSVEAYGTKAPGSNTIPAPSVNIFNGTSRPVLNYIASSASDISINAASTETTGNYTPANIEQPILSMYYIICVSGQFPYFN